MTVPEPRVTRPRPSAEWAVQWHDGPYGSALHARRLTVRASYGTPPIVPRPAATDDPDAELPTRITVTTTDANRSDTTLLLDRSAAEDLAELLTTALGWDGR